MIYLQVLELEPLKKKKLKLILLQTEFPIEWSLEPNKAEENGLFPNLKFVSKEYLNFIEDLIQNYKLNFVVEEKGNRTPEEFLYDNPLMDVFNKHQIPYKMVDISENALLYISSTLNTNRTLLKGINSEIENLTKGKGKINYTNPYLQQLIIWNEYLKEDFKEKENEVRFTIREYWMIMEITELAKKLEENKLTALFICDKSHFDNVTKVATDLGITTEKINFKRVAKDLLEPNSIKDFINNSMLEIVPVKIKNTDKTDKILYFFDTDDFASPFDINMAYDAGFDIVVPFNKVTKENVTKLVQDAIFSRKPKASTTFFVGGSNVKEGEIIGKKVLNTLVPPFETPVIIDPRGSHTTAAAVVAKTIEVANDLEIPTLLDKKVVVLGTGPVGRIASIIASKLNCRTVLVETWDGASEESVKNLANELTEEAGENDSNIEGEFATTDDKKLEILKDADIIWSLATAGVQIVSKDLMAALPPNKIVVDVNAVPPFGIEGLKPKDDKKEIYPGINGIGSLAVGNLKYMIESNILKEATNTKGKAIFDYNFAFQIAQNILFGKKITVSQV